MIEIMTDIETLSTDPEAAVLSIGACAFDITQQDAICGRFYQTISIASNIEAGRHISAGTLEWWMGQNPDALRALFEDTTNLKQACKRFRIWVEQYTGRHTRWWANDPEFDYVKLEQAFKAVNEVWPAFFANYRSFRTITGLAYPDREERKAMIKVLRDEGTHHNAADDAVAQARAVQHCYQILRRRTTSEED